VPFVADAPGNILLIRRKWLEKYCVTFNAIEPREILWMRLDELSIFQMPYK
jgi:hypothetical protein